MDEGWSEQVKDSEFEFEFDRGDIVYLKTDLEQEPRMVIGYLIEFNDIKYILMSGTYRTFHYAIELSLDKDVKLKTGN